MDLGISYEYYADHKFKFRRPTRFSEKCFNHVLYLLVSLSSSLDLFTVSFFVSKSNFGVDFSGTVLAFTGCLLKASSTRRGNLIEASLMFALKVLKNYINY